MPRRKGELRARRSSNAPLDYVAGIDFDDPESVPPCPLTWQHTTVREGARRFESDVAEEMDAARVIDEGDDDSPRSCP